MEFSPVPADEPPALDLIEAMVAEIVAMYAARGENPTVSTEPGGMVPPRGVFLVGDEGGEPVCGGGVRPLAEHIGEVKRMYVVPHARGRQVGRALLGALEDAARELGYARLRLDTGADQPGARHLYESAGYASIPDYNGNPWAGFWGEKRL
jgi:GNAT superfamily N-acetyltransferase